MTITNDTALATRSEEVDELAPSMSSAAVEAEIKAAITLALRFPRNEDKAFERLMRACRRTSFAEDVSYSFPRGDSEVTGPSVYLAREAARVWGNVRHGYYIISDGEHDRTIEAWAWDLEQNDKVVAQDNFEKLIYRKKGGWVKPDERDLRELTNRRAAILKRNCILEILPKDLIEDARDIAAETLRAKAAQDPDGERKKILLAFSQINVTAELLAQILGHSVAQSSPVEIAKLRQIYKSIADGNSTFADYLPQDAKTTNGKAETPKEPAGDNIFVSDVFAASQAVGWTTKKAQDFIREKFSKDLTQLEKGKECGAAIAAIREAATAPGGAEPSAKPTA